MILSGLRQVIRKWNSQHPHHEIKNPYQLFKELNKKGLHISRPTITKLWNDSPSKHGRKSPVYKPAENIHFEVLDKLVKFFNVPVGDIVQFISNPTEIKVLRTDDFLKEYSSDLDGLHPLKADIRLNDYTRSQAVIIISDHHKYPHSNVKNYKFYVFVIPYPFGVDLGNGAVGYYIFPVNAYCNRYYKNKHSDPYHYLKILGHIFGHLSKSEHEYLDDRVFQTDGFGHFVFPHCLVIDGFNGNLANFKIGSKVFPSFELMNVGQVKRPIVRTQAKATDYSFRFLN